MHMEANVLPLDVRRNIALLKLMFNTAYKAATNGDLHLDKEGVNTRSSKQKNFVTIRPRYEWYRKSVVYQDKKRWLDLPLYLKVAENIRDFSNKVNLYYVKEFKETGVVR